MTSLQDGPNNKNGKGNSRTTIGLFATVFMHVAASLFAAIGSAPGFLAASAQLPDDTQQPSTSNTTTASPDNQDLTTVDPMEKANEACGSVMRVLIIDEMGRSSRAKEP